MTNRSRNVVLFWGLLHITNSCFGFIEQWLKRDFPPNTPEVMAYLQSARHPTSLHGYQVTERDLIVWRMYQEIIEILLRSYPQSHILFFGRDLEMLYDAYQVLVLPDRAGGAALAPISRLVARNSSVQAVTNLLSELGMDFERLKTGKQHVIWLDTGSKGTIYKNLLWKIYRQWGEESSIEELTSIFRHITPLLLYSSGPDTSSHMLSSIRRARAEGNTISLSMFEEQWWFGELDSELLNRFNVPSHLRGRSRWVVENIEHGVKWNERPKQVSENGVFSYEGRTRYTGHLDRTKHLSYRVALIEHFHQIAQSCSFRLRRVPDPSELSGSGH